MIVSAVRVPVKDINIITKKFRDLTLSIPKVKNVLEIENDKDHKLVLFEK